MNNTWSIVKDKVVPTIDECLKIHSRMHLWKLGKKPGSSTVAPWIANPYAMASSIKDPYKAIRYYFIALLFNWTELADSLKKRLKEDFSCTKENITDIYEVFIKNFDFAALNSKLKTLNENISNIDLEEKIETHSTLNPLLFTDDNHLKNEILEKINKIIEAFLNSLSELNIPLKIKDVVLIGSNAGYNYTENSDLDIHIIADSSVLKNSLLATVYELCKSKFNKKYNIAFYGIPVEIYVEMDNLDATSNGIYSILKNDWIKEPEPSEIPLETLKEVKKEFKNIENNYFTFIKKDNLTSEEIENFITEIYELRQQTLKNSEYSLGNLLFKEFRNKGYLDNLKTLKDEIKSKELSLIEAFNKNKKYIKNKILESLNKIPIDIKDFNFNGFKIELPETSLNSCIKNLLQIPFIENLEKGIIVRYKQELNNPIPIPIREIRGNFKFKKENF